LEEGHEPNCPPAFLGRAEVVLQIMAKFMNFQMILKMKELYSSARTLLGLFHI